MEEEVLRLLAIERIRARDDLATSAQYVDERCDLLENHDAGAYFQSTILRRFEDMVGGTGPIRTGACPMTTRTRLR